MDSLDAARRFASTWSSTDSPHLRHERVCRDGSDGSDFDTEIPTTDGAISYWRAISFNTGRLPIILSDPKNIASWGAELWGRGCDVKDLLWWLILMPIPEVEINLL
jgi:hypothetical protein